MTEAVSLVLDFAFAAHPDGLNLQRVEWHAFAGNTASAAVARRAGFRFEGASRLGAVQRGARRDDWQAGLLRDDPRTPADGWPAETGAAR
jgi:RimJ/RimL family protein N-acetyltransferase